MDSQLKILITAALNKTAGKDLNEKLQKLKIQPIRVPVTLAKGVANTLNKQLKELKLKSYEIPLSVSSKSIKNAAKNINDQLNGNNVNTSLDSTLKKINTFRTRLADIQQSSYGLAHPIIDDQNQEKLSIAYKKIDDTINTVIKSGQKMTAAQEISIRKQISDVERLRKAYVQIERGAMALEQKPITFDIEKTKTGLSALEAKWKNQGVYSGEFKKNIESIKVALSTVSDQEGISKINQDISLAKIKAGELNTELRRFDSITAQSTARNKFSAWLRENPKAVKLFKKEIEDLGKSIPKITNPALNTAFNKQFADITSGLKAMGATGDTIFNNLLKNMQKFATWLVASGGIMSAIMTFKRMISTVIDLDKALVNLQMATNGTYKETVKLLEGYTQLGLRLGATTAEVASAGNDWLRQGKSIADTNTLIEDSLILSKIGVIGTAEATQFLTSATKGYNVAVEDTIKIVDMLSAVDLKSATSAGGLAEAMSRTAASAQIAGISMEKLLGYLALVQETTQKDASSIGESFKFGAAAA